ncbi:DUF4199 domain-containing protein [Abyssalbus ytuae]|uniref:DUF4199 domain-containing protein n=1 Tax=Abyssalbus ytuae TaxID=2926907 RepID=A0A9E6ZV37_9FLAO|nr:DUF4199 domain-containing protein [Abyssalbus ytuae]UOB17341.1 DUF4199 domain-containing protein [Abyssalbus ytuae]
MENIEPKTGKFALNYGLLLGGITIVFSLMLFMMDMHYERSTATTIVNIAVMIAVICLAIYQFKKSNEGYLSLAQALKVGIGVALVAAVIGIIYMLIFTSLIEPEFWDKSFEMAKAVMAEQNPELTSDQINNAIEMQKKFLWLTYPFILLFNLFAGFVVSLIAGLAMKKSKSEY